MEANFKQLVDALSITPFSNDLLRSIIVLIEQQTPKSLSSFVSQSIQSLLILKHWAWQWLSQDYHQWINQSDYITLFHSLALFNKNLIFNDDQINDETKASLLIPNSIDQINGMFEQVNRSNDDYSPLIIIVNLWLDNLSFFVQEYPQFDTSSVICHINQYLGRNYLMTDRFQLYLTQLQQQQITQSIFSARQLFYIKTCSFSLAAYLCANVQKSPFTAEEVLQHVGKGYLQIMNIHSHTMQSWNDELLMCIAHLTGFIHSCYWWAGEITVQRKMLFPTEQITCDFAQALIQIIKYEPFHREIKPKLSNNETILLNVTSKFVIFLIQLENIAWFFRSDLSLLNTLLILAANSEFDQICIRSYGILSEILTDEQLKELKVTDTVAVFFFNMLKQGWHHPLKKCKQVPILQLLIGCSTLAKSDALKQKIADLDELPFLIEISDQYPIVYDILWALSFNHDIQQQLRSNSIFMSKLANPAKECDNEKMRKIIHGIRWNLEINHKDHSANDMKDRNTFDIMISYSHKDKVLCKQIYDELIKAGYRIWIDFDQMHGNVMDAMAQAIEQSQTVIICMSEDYRKSNFCRAEAHYAFQRERKIVPVLLQKHYKPDGWLLFLIGQLLYVDFNKYEFNRAMEMLFKELKGTDTIETNAVIIQPKQETVNILPKLNLSPILPKNLVDWTETHVQTWLLGHNFLQMSHLLAGFNGRSLLYLNDYLKSSETLNLLQEDSLRKTGQTLSLTELSRFRSFMDETKQVLITSDNHVDEQSRFVCCRMM